MGDASQLLWGIILGAIGLGFLVYGRKQKAAVPFLVGVTLIALPYFVANVYVLVLTALVLVAIPFFVRI